MLFITHRLHAYLLKITSGRWPPFTSVHCCKHVWKLRPHCSWSSMLHGEHTTSLFKFLHPSQHGIPRRYTTMSTNIQLSSKDTMHFCHTLRFVIIRCYSFQWSTATDHMKWRPLLYSSPFAPTTTSYCAGAIFKCVSPLCATLYVLYWCSGNLWE